MSWLDFDQIEQAAKANFLSILKLLGVSYKRQGPYYQMLNSTRDDSNYGSFVYHIGKNIWKEFATDEGGKGVVSLCAYLWEVPYVTAARELDIFLEGHPAAAGGPTAKPSKVPKVDFMFHRISNRTIPIVGTLAETYLLSRGINPALVQNSIRFVERCEHLQSGEKFPAMVAGLCLTVGETPYLCKAVHCIYLNKDGTAKADVRPNKVTFGAAKGMAVPLHCPLAETIAVGEGIETCLSFQQATGIPTFAGCSTSGLMNFILPPLPRGKTVVIVADNDAPGLFAASKAAEKWLVQGRKVTISKPSDGYKDFNDLLRRKS